jgi:hypothetical protein
VGTGPPSINGGEFALSGNITGKATYGPWNTSTRSKEFYGGAVTTPVTEAGQLGAAVTEQLRPRSRDRSQSSDRSRNRSLDRATVTSCDRGRDQG